MRKILIMSLLVAYSHLTSAQNAGENVSALNDTTLVGTNTVLLEERLNKHEEQLNSLKKENEVLKKQMKQLQTLFNSNRKVVVSRTGSKQLIVE
jgi:hypothetical protein